VQRSAEGGFEIANPIYREIIFDRRPGQPPLAQRTRSEAATRPSGRAVTVVRA